MSNETKIGENGFKYVEIEPGPESDETVVVDNGCPRDCEYEFRDTNEMPCRKCIGGDLLEQVTPPRSYFQPKLPAPTPEPASETCEWCVDSNGFYYRRVSAGMALRCDTDCIHYLAGRTPCSACAVLLGASPRYYYRTKDEPTPEVVDDGGQIFRAVLQELERAESRFAPFNSSHEGYAVIKEELDELWDEIKNNKSPDTLKRQRKEAIQVGAMALRFLKMLEAKDAMIREGKGVAR